MTKIKTIGDIDVFVTEAGKFQATVRGETIIMASLSALEKKINTPQEELELIVMQWGRFQKRTIVGTRKRRSRSWGRPDYELVDKQGETHAHGFNPGPEWDAVEAAVREIDAEGDQDESAYRARRQDRDQRRNAEYAKLTKVTAETLRATTKGS